MTALTRFFFRTAIDRPTAWTTVEWWESRRLVYNAVVGAAGLVTISWVTLLHAVIPGWGFQLVPWQLPVAYGVMANLCYTFGWGAELALRRLVGDNAAPAGAAIFRYGFVFSVGLTILPAFVATMAAVATLVSHFLVG